MVELIKMFSLSLKFISTNLTANYRLFAKLNKNYENLKLVASGRCIHTSVTLEKKRKTAEEKKSRNVIQYPPKGKGEMVDVWRNITVSELAQVLKRDVSYVHELFLGTVRGSNAVISDIKVLHNAIRRSGKRMRIIGKPDDDVKEKLEEKDVFPRPPPSQSDLKPRPPIVTILGHVDHGKTTLLDALRHSSIVEQEFGGITQHIGAFSVKLESGAVVTFLDTPGHAAFSAMRARGTDLTDIVVLVVAADDGVMEQTTECIRMATQANVPILVAINKIDSPKANIKRTEEMLMQKGIQVENLGGDIQSVCISALKRTNLKELTEALVLQAELMEIGGDPSGPVEAVVIESRLDQHRGSLCTVVVERGTLKKGDILVADTSMAKVRSLKNELGQHLEQVGPGFPAEVEGWKSIPSAGQVVLQVESEKHAKFVIKLREIKKATKKIEQDAVLIAAKEEEHLKVYKENLALKRRLGRFKLKPEGLRKPEIENKDEELSLKIIIKSDVDGTLEAILETLSSYRSSECELLVINFGVGAVTENDIELAETFKGVVYAFNVDCSNAVIEKAKESGVSIKNYNIIYNLIDSIKEDINARLPPKEVEDILGEAKVLQQFLINDGRKKLPIAGCLCTKGVIKRKAFFRVIRDGNTIYDGTLISMRYLKSEAETVKANFECGLQLADKTILFEPDDIIICYEKRMKSQSVNWDPGF